MELKIKWNKVEDAEYPFMAHLNGHNLQLRVNDFPEEPFFTLIVDGECKEDLDDWPETWEGNEG